MAALAAFALVAGMSSFHLLPAQKPRSAHGPDPRSVVVQLVAVGPAAHGNERQCLATGFFVNPDGDILTVAHAVNEARRCLGDTPGVKILARFPGPNPRVADAVSCDLVGLDEAHDLAVLRTIRPPFALEPACGKLSCPQGPRLSGADLATEDSSPGWLTIVSDEPPLGSRVTVIGYPGSSWHAVTATGHLVSRNQLILFEKIAEQSDVIAIDISLQKGASGSPVLDEAGAVVGLVDERDPWNPAWTIAVTAKYAVKLLDRLGIHRGVVSLPFEGK